jgi:hypothetical protein
MEGNMTFNPRSKAFECHAGGRLLSLLECEDRTGRKVATWRKDILRRKIPFVRIGRQIRVPADFIEKLIADGYHDIVQTPSA